MGVLTLVLGAALLLWSHIIWCAHLRLLHLSAWGSCLLGYELPAVGCYSPPFRVAAARRLVVLLLSMYRFMRWEVKLAPGASASTVSASAVSETDRSQLGGGEPAGGEAEQSGDEGATVGGAAAAAPSRPGLMRRLKFWGRPGA